MNPLDHGPWGYGDVETPENEAAYLADNPGEELEPWEVQDRNRRLGLVDCDDHCGAKLAPETLEEALAAVAHWKSHGYLSGCSHAC
ncbi:MAG: hypothetical protein JWO67_4505 [Streptosporangiaceae bacterium]|nr:hypothetical protein [Streptosporangiaceae bacterium]